LIFEYVKPCIEKLEGISQNGENHVFESW